jgi:choice-of-anchor C domain-containing protein
MNRAFVAAACAAFFATSAQGATIVNASFEDGTNPGTYTTVGVGQTNITGWTVSAGSVDYIGTYWQAAEGVRSVDLAGGSLGTLEQAIGDTVAGLSYMVTFALSKNPDGGAPTRTGTFQAGDETFNFSYALPNTRPNNMLWQDVSFTFFSEGPTTIRFAADASAGCCYGPAIDNVRITALVPEPATWAFMIVGFGAVGGAMRAARRKAYSLATA